MPHVRQYITDLGKAVWFFGAGIIIDLVALAQTAVDAGLWSGIQADQRVHESVYWAIGSLLIIGASFKAYATKTKALESAESRNSHHILREEFTPKNLEARNAMDSIIPLLERAYYGFANEQDWRFCLTDDPVDAKSGLRRFMRQLVSGGLLGGHLREGEPKQFRDAMRQIGAYLDDVDHYRRKLFEFYEEEIVPFVRDQWRDIVCLIVAHQYELRFRDLGDQGGAPNTGATRLWDEWKNNGEGPPETDTED